MPPMIRFGTSGWRGVVSDDFTFQNVRKVAHSVAGCVKESPEVGYNSDDYRQFLAGAVFVFVGLIAAGVIYWDLSKRGFETVVE